MDKDMEDEVIFIKKFDSKFDSYGAIFQKKSYKNQF